MHASISAHLSNEYLMNEETDSWGHNLEEFTRRLGNSAVKERVENMYFTYLFVLRAVLKAGPLLESVDYSTGCQDQDEHTKKLMQQLVSLWQPLSRWLWCRPSTGFPMFSPLSDELCSCGIHVLRSFRLETNSAIATEVMKVCCCKLVEVKLRNGQFCTVNPCCRSAMRRSSRLAPYLLMRAGCGKELMQQS